MAWPAYRDQSASPANGGGTASIVRRGTTTWWRTRRDIASGSIAKAFTGARPVHRRAGSCMDCLRERKAMTAYAELAVTTNFSFLRGASHPQEMVATAGEL